MKGRYPVGPLRVPALIGLVTAVALVAALLYDGAAEAVSVLMLAAVVGLIGLRLFQRPGTGRH
ncbi:hypothetical protein [Brevundimonas sp.]|uniref:hypothetical protein n=1 Tax=Brevundimonas sp. TaxID=1871086 RepID=UPI003D0E0FA4